MNMLTRLTGKSLHQRTILDELSDISWDFERKRSRSLFSSIHFHPGRFISQLPSILISLLSEEGEVVLDPYCGSGTTLVEAKRLHRKGIGIDINPVSILVTSAKTLGLNQNDIEESLNQFFLVLTRASSKSDLFEIPAQVQVEKWYTRSVSSDLHKLYNDIMHTDDLQFQNLKWFCFSSILLKVCNETRHWGYVCDNTMPKEKPIRSVSDQLQSVIFSIIQGYIEHHKMAGNEVVYSPKLLNDRSENMSKFLEPNSVDLVVTSPPYFGVVDYVKSQRLTLEWLGLELEPLRAAESGARSKRHRLKGSLEFEAELSATFNNLFRVLKPGKYCAVIFGASKSRSFKTDDLITIATMQGFEHLGEIERQISAQRSMNPSLTTEMLYLFRKPVS